MKKTSLALAALAFGLTLSAQGVRPRTVQGIDYRSTLSAGQQSLYSYNDDAARSLKAATQSLSLDDLKYWVGEGENRAALVIQFGDESEDNALAFGYRWSGDATCEDMVRAVMTSHPQLYGILQYTGSYGYTIGGLGWDVHNDRAFDIQNDNQGAYLTADDSDNGLFDISDYTLYDYVNWQPVDTYDYWMSGWGDPYYWSYYYGESLTKYGYSSLGMTSQPVKDGEWHIWINSQDSQLKTVAAAPSVSVERFEFNGLYYSVLDADAKTVAVVTDGNYGYAGYVEIPATVENEGETYTVTEIAGGAFMGCAVTMVSIPETVTKISREAFMGTTLMEQTIPASVKFIGSNAFAYCTELTSLTAKAKTPAEAKENAFEGSEETMFYVPAGTMDAYATATGWSALTNINELEADDDDDDAPAASEQTFIDFSKINVWVGEGDKTAALVLNWNDDLGMDNLVLGVKFSDSEKLSAEDVLTRAADGFARLTYADGTLTYDLYGNGTISTYDHTATTVKYFVDKGEGITASDASIADKSVVYVSTGELSDYPKYTFYVPTDEKTGVWTLDEVSYPISSTQLSFPVYLNVGGSGITCTALTYKVTNADGTTDTSVISKQAISNVAKGNTTVLLTAAGIGDAYISLRARINNVYTDYTTPCTVHVTPAETLIESIKITEFGDEPVSIEELGLLYKKLSASSIEVTPANAGYQTVTYEFIPDIITNYNNTYFLAKNQPGECVLVAKACDGSGVVSEPVKFIVTERERVVPEDEYQDGTFILNEDWFGHSVSSLNYLDADDNIYYNAYETNNIGTGFGSTAQFATFFGDRLYVSSKQADDKGQNGIAGGGRLVIADAKTLKRIASFDEVGNDGRCVYGVNPNKVYVGMSKNIRVLNVDNDENTFTLGSTITTGEILEMKVAAGRVFAFDKTNKKVLVIDPETDTVETDLATSASALTQAYDGKIWVALTTGELNAYDPETLEVVQTATAPKAIASTAGKPMPFWASETENVLYWTIANGWTGAYLYRWKTDEDMPTAALASLTGNYSVIRVDSRTGDLVYAGPQTTTGDGNFIKRLDGVTGEVKTHIDLANNFWYPSMPLFPDKYAPEFDFDQIETDLEPVTINLAEKVSDKDNIDYNITVSMDVVDGTEFADFVLEGKELTITPAAAGQATICLTAVSNGRVVSENIPVYVGKKTGVSDGVVLQGSIKANGRVLNVNQYNGTVFAVYDMNGRQVSSFMADSDRFSVRLNVADGVYVIRSLNAASPVAKKLIIK